jgi:hypothetical protein
MMDANVCPSLLNWYINGRTGRFGVMACLRGLFEYIKRA